MKEEENNREIIGIIDNDEDNVGNAIPECNKKLKKNWAIANLSLSEN